MNKPLIIAHANCSDGFTSYWIAQRYMLSQEYGKQCDYHPGIYGKDPPDVTGRRVYLLDFSYKRPILEKMAEKAESIIVIDHHKSAEADLKDINLPNIQTKFDMAKSGAMLTWEYFWSDFDGIVATTVPAPMLVKYVQDRDLFNHQLPDTHEINRVIFSYEQTLENWDILALKLQTENGYKQIVEEGRAILRYRDKYIEDMVKQAQVVELSNKWGKYAGMKIPVVNCSYWEISDLLGKLCSDHPFAVGYFRRSDGIWQYSLRSKEFDVSEIAKNVLQGGGHKLSAGGQLKELLI